MKNFFILTCGFLIMWIKPYIFFLLLLPFIFDYYYFIFFFFQCLKYKKNNKYYCIQIEEKNLWNFNILTLWIEINKIQAFEKVYYTYSKKNIKKTIAVLIIYLLGIPIRILNLIKHFYDYNNYNYKHALEILYTLKYNIIKTKKIEIYNGQVYLNCASVKKALLIITKNNSNLDKQQLFDLSYDIREIIKDFNKFDNIKKEFIKMNSSYIVLDNNQKLTPHYSYEEKGNVIHATSKIPEKLSNNQKVTSNMISLTLETAANPGTILSEKTKIIMTRAYRWIPEKELNIIKYEGLGMFDLDIEKIKYIEKKNDIFSNCFKHYNTKINKAFLHHLIAGSYDGSFLNTKNQQLIEEINDLFKENNHPDL